VPAYAPAFSLMPAMCESWRSFPEERTRTVQPACDTCSARQRNACTVLRKTCPLSSLPSNSLCCRRSITGPLTALDPRTETAVPRYLDDSSGKSERKAENLVPRCCRLNSLLRKTPALGRLVNIVRMPDAGVPVFVSRNMTIFRNGIVKQID
jgi:hypothetical protein